jgi:hypothetical protein
MNLIHLGYRLIKWAPISRAIKFRLERDLMNWHWSRNMKVAEQTKDPDHIERGHNEWQFEAAMLADEEQAYFSRKLLKRAPNLRVMVPAYYEDNKLSDSYEESSLTSKVNLSLKGEIAVRAAIREEEEHRAKQRSRWVPYIAALTGLAGAVTGLISSMDKFGK